MAAIDLPKSPNVFHPEKPSAVGSRNSLAQEFRDQQAEVDLLLSEEVDKVMNHVTSKLPKETLERLDVMGGLKEKILAAHRIGIKTVLIPRENEKSIEEIPKRILKAVKLIPVNHMDEVLKRSLVRADSEDLLNEKGIREEPIYTTPVKQTTEHQIVTH